MTKTMPGIAADFSKQVDNTLSIIGSTEALWMTAPPTSKVRRQLKAQHLEALYEAAYLRVFCAWESLLEESLVRLMSGYRTSSHSPTAASGQRLLPTVKSARATLYSGSRYLLWHDP